MEGLTRLNKAILEGDTAVAVTLLDRFPNEMLCSQKVQGKWALHSLHPVAFEDASRLEFTKQVIMKYIRAGWDIESKSNYSKASDLAQSWNMDFNHVRCTLLHLACINKSLGVIELLVEEEVGADVNSLTAGQVQLSPLHILLMQKEWEAARYLVERGADLNLMGRLEGQLSFTSVAQNGDIAGSLHRFRDYSCLNPAQLLLRMGHQAGLAVLHQMLTRIDNRVVWQGAREFHLALEGTNPNFVAKVLEHRSGMISTEDLSWITLRGDDGALTAMAPSLLWLLRILATSEIDTVDREQDLVTSLAHLITRFHNLGYILNLNFVSITLWRYFTPPQPLIAFALRIDRFRESNRLLRTILQVDTFRLNGMTLVGRYNPMEEVLSMPYPHCSSNPFPDQPRIRCWEMEIPETDEDETLLGALRLLVTHGLDVNGGVIGRTFVYHSGYTPILQMLYRAGAVFSDTFFSEPIIICLPGSLEAPELFLRELQELKEWKEDFDRNRMTLKNMSRMEARKLLRRRVGAVRILDQLLPPLPRPFPLGLKNAVLCISDLKISQEC